jgi:hypothetical protein
MAAPNGYPSWVYSRTEPAVIVRSLEAFSSLTGTWGTTPSPQNPPQRPDIDLPGTPLAALLAILALLTQRLPEPPAALLATVPSEPDAEKEHAEKEHGHRKHAEVEEPAEPKTRNHRGRE